MLFMGDVGGFLFLLTVCRILPHYVLLWSSSKLPDQNCLPSYTLSRVACQTSLLSLLALEACRTVVTDPAGSQSVCHSRVHLTQNRAEGNKQCCLQL